MPTVMKFGGTSVADAHAFENVARIVASQRIGRTPKSTVDTPAYAVSRAVATSIMCDAAQYLVSVLDRKPVLAQISCPLRRHPLYHKRITRTSKFLAHDEENAAKVGDEVAIVETRPLSRRKRWIAPIAGQKAQQG